MVSVSAPLALSFKIRDNSERRCEGALLLIQLVVVDLLSRSVEIDPLVKSAVWKLSGSLIEFQLRYDPGNQSGRHIALDHHQSKDIM